MSEAPASDALRDAATNARAGLRYSAVAIGLHWTIAGLIGWNLVLGFRMHGATGLAQFDLFQLHKSVGLSVLLLSLARLVWRLGHPPPPLPADMRRSERVLARAAHAGLYLIMIGMPLTGWIVVSTSPLNIPTLLFHTIPWPHMPVVHTLAPEVRKDVNGVFGWSHVVLAWGALGLIALHIAGAVKHALIERDGVMWRMLPLSFLRANKG